LLVDLLREAAHQPFQNDGDANEAPMFQHYVAEILQILDKRSDVGTDVLVELEWAYLAVLEYAHRPARALLRAVSERPALFVEVLSAAFKTSDESGSADKEPEISEQARAIAIQAYRLLELWNHLPGTRDDGTIDGEVLRAWINEARKLAEAVGREEIADSRIGKMLSASPVGTDRNWPAEAVRDVIDLFRSQPMVEGFWIGKSNRRGVTARRPGDGGSLERRESEKYRRWAEAIEYEHPRTARALRTLAESYEGDARRADENAERLDWEY
jgi:hypothetical protein